MRRLVDGAVIASGWVLLAFTLLVAFEVVARRFFSFSVQGVDEIGGYVMALLGALGFSAALLAGAHIRIDLLLPRFGVRGRLWLELVALLALAVFAGFLVWCAWSVLEQTLAMRAVAPTPLRTPLLIPQGFWAAALLLFLVAALTAFVATLRQALGRKAHGGLLASAPDNEGPTAG